VHRLVLVTSFRPAADVAVELDELPTEAWDPEGADLDLRSTRELVDLMNAADASIPAAVASAAGAIGAAIDAVAARLAAGGRLVYVGAGTSGRLAVVDAAECESTFSAPPGLVTALVAGGAASAATAQEHAEDDAEAGEQELRQLELGANDAVVGISASGRTPYVLGALAEATRVGALTVALVSVEGSELGRVADHEIAVVVGAEVVSGSTRLKAGTAQKLVLNMISTITMIRLGKTYGNLMVDVVATNEKLRARVRRIVKSATGEPDDRVDGALDAAGGDARVAIVLLLAGVDAHTARRRLEAAGGVVRKALQP
jgi:N-acetylmuramic acid 6-phosphate etherase